MNDNLEDPEIITSRHNGMLTRDGITVEVNICRLADSKWSLEVVDRDNNSIVWDGEFETGPLAASWHSNKLLDPVADGPHRLRHLEHRHDAPPGIVERTPIMACPEPPGRHRYL